MLISLILVALAREARTHQDDKVIALNLFSFECFKKMNISDISNASLLFSNLFVFMKHLNMSIYLFNNYVYSVRLLSSL